MKNLPLLAIALLLILAPLSCINDTPTPAPEPEPCTDCPPPDDDPGDDDPGGNDPGGDDPGGDNPGGNDPGGDDPGGDDPGGDDPGGDNPGGNDPGGDDPGGDDPGGDDPGGDDPGEPQPLGDVSAIIETLGNPLRERYADNTQWVFARNVWDMHAFAGKIYFGGGNSNNEPPAVNAGPADLWALDPATRQFTKEYTVNEEQIHLLRDFDDQLYIPGHDSREGWNLGNFYRLTNGVWKKHRTVPLGIHVYDIYKWGGRLYAAIGPDGGRGIQVSDDDGTTWTGAFDYPSTTSRHYTLVPVGNELMANIYYLSSAYSVVFYCPEPGAKFVYSIDRELASRFALGTLSATRMERAVVMNGTTVYVSARDDTDHQYVPLALARARSRTDVSQVGLPAGALPRDLLVAGDWLLVLISTPVTEGGFEVAVLATRDVDAANVEWLELLRFTAPTFARSFEYLDGAFYFGLGCEPADLATATGDILTVPFEGLLP
ncbi:MAG: hypothetical protein LBR57_04035 [Alistipes sp.]|jgi:hypothetical protein|nr:hypothetical protein [Alistipes sp.]